MSHKIVFHVEKRAVSSKFGNSQRKLGLIPGNLFGLNKASESVQMNGLAFKKLYSQEGDTGLVYVQIDEEKEQAALISEVQVSPVSGDIIHAAFKRVNLKAEIEVEIEIEMVGENNVPQATVLRVLDAIVVRALPTDLPEKFQIDISTLTEIGQSITIGQLEYDQSKVQLVLTGDTTVESPVAVLQETREEVVEEDSTPAEVEITTAKADAPADSDTPEESEK